MFFTEKKVSFDSNHKQQKQKMKIFGFYLKIKIKNGYQPLNNRSRLRRYP